MKYAIFHKGRRLPGEYSCGQEAQCAIMRSGAAGWKLKEYEVKKVDEQEISESQAGGYAPRLGVQRSGDASNHD